MNKKKTAILFDLDGTLVDSLPDLRAAVNTVLAEWGRRRIGAGEIRAAVGDGAAMMIDRCVAMTGEPAGDALPMLVGRYIEAYRRALVVDTRPYPGVETTLHRLREDGHKLGVATNKPTALAVGLLKALGLDGYFAAVVGGDGTPERKPSAVHLLTTLKAMGEDGNQGLMVGDSANDVGAARAAAMPVVVVRYGYAQVPPDALGADLVIDSFSSLPTAASRYL